MAVLEVEAEVFIRRVVVYITKNRLLEKWQYGFAQTRFKMTFVLNLMTVLLLKSEEKEVANSDDVTKCINN